MKAIRRWPSYEVFLGLLSPKTTLHCNAEAFKASLTRNKKETMGFKFGWNEVVRRGSAINFRFTTRRKLGPVYVHEDFWDGYWGRAGHLLANFVTCPM